MWESKGKQLLSYLIYERTGKAAHAMRICSKGDNAFFGKSTQDMRSSLKVPKSRPLADFLPTITIKAKDFANEITNFNIKRDNLASEQSITREHVKNNTDVRKILTDRDIRPELLPPAEDIKKLERRVKSEEKKLPASAKKLPPATSNDETE
jgi:DNA-damage-inducible protein D